MTVASFLRKLLGGLISVAALLYISFSILSSVVVHFGATPYEIMRTYPGDFHDQRPSILWTHAIDIQAAPKDIWPWIAQMGDSRGGFYSYTPIENAITKPDLYKNADHILPQFQKLEIGQPVIGDDFMLVKSFEEGKWLLLESTLVGWRWLWYLEQTGQSSSRLIVRMGIYNDQNTFSRLQNFFFNYGGFVMELKMLKGIKLRAEGGTESDLTPSIEIILWMISALIAIASASVFLIRKFWVRAYITMLTATLVTVLQMFVQPPMAERYILVVLVIAGFVWSVWKIKDKGGIKLFMYRY